MPLIGEEVCHAAHDGSRNLLPQARTSISRLAPFRRPHAVIDDAELRAIDPLTGKRVGLHRLRIRDHRVGPAVNHVPQSPKKEMPFHVISQAAPARYKNGDMRQSRSETRGHIRTGKKSVDDRRFDFTEESCKRSYLRQKDVEGADISRGIKSRIPKSDDGYAGLFKFHCQRTAPPQAADMRPESLRVKPDGKLIELPFGAAQLHV